MNNSFEKNPEERFNSETIKQFADLVLERKAATGERSYKELLEIIFREQAIYNHSDQDWLFPRIIAEIGRREREKKRKTQEKERQIREARGRQLADERRAGDSWRESDIAFE